jgi:signal transduction histidine kinase
LPVELNLRAERQRPEPVEAAAYHMVSEALTNADGIGRADPRQGSGLVGLSDRVEALSGTLQLTGSAGSGTTLLVEIPLERRSSAVPSRP